MKLGSETGSLVNHLYSRGTKGQPQPVVGMGVTFLHWTDRSAGTIVSVETLKNGDIRIGTQGDFAKRVDTNGMSESQTYEYTPDTEAHVSYWRFNTTSGGWRSVYQNEKGRWVYSKSSTGLRIGDRDKYHDFSF